MRRARAYLVVLVQFGSEWRLRALGRELRDAELRDTRRVFEKLSDAARDDVSVVLAAVRKGGHCLEHASKACRNDKDVVIAAVQQHGCSLLHDSGTIPGRFFPKT